MSTSAFQILLHSAPSWILSKVENLASTSLQDGATKWHYYEETTHPPAANLFLTDPMATGSLFWSAVSPPIGTLFRKYVRCPPPLLAPCSENMCGVPPSHYTLFLCRVPRDVYITSWSIFFPTESDQGSIFFPFTSSFLRGLCAFWHFLWP